MGTEPSTEGLDNLSLACSRLWQLDVNRAQPGRDYQLNVQRGKKSYQDQDVAGDPLFSQVDPAIFQQRPTYSLFFALLNNYHAQTGTAEHFSQAENREMTEFLDAVCQTPCVQYVHNLLVSKRLADADLRSFKQQLYQMWFQTYTRQVRDDSSGFEHVFVGESDEGKIKGFHNWIQFSNLERKGQVDYKGYIFPRVRTHNGQQQDVNAQERMLTLQFSWGGETKDVSSMFIGTSPEFELALYSLCFLAGQEDNVVEVGDYEVRIKAYRIKSKYGDKVGSCFPEMLQRIAGRDGAQAYEPAPVSQQMPWQGLQGAPQQPPQTSGWQQPAHQAPAGSYAAAAAGQPQPQYQPQQQQQQGAWEQPPAQQQYHEDGQHANQGCGSFVVSVLKALFGNSAK